MEVTRTNFQEVLIELDEILKNATFLAIDGEFTGLNSGPDASAFDTPSQYYAKLRTGSMDFLLVQLGLSVFTFNPDNKKYIQRSYNFYVFPKPFNRSTPDCRFMCQASSISFLANQGFDFNKLFKYGIPYLTKDEEEKLNKKLEEKQKARDEEEFDLIPIPDNDKTKIEEVCSKVDSFVDSEDKELTIDKCNAFIRRLIYQEVKLRWPNKIRLESKNENGNQYLIAYKIGTDDEERIKDVERKEKEKLEVQEAVGLSALLRKIADSEKLIVGHNMLLDLCHIIHQFFGPLPESYREFKSLVHGLFPKLLDTKVICQSSQFKDTVPSSILNHLLETLQLSPFELPVTENIKDRSYTLVNNKLHEAGYDAYITGLCFISLCNRLGSLQKPEVSNVLADSPLLYPYLNKLLITRLKDYPHINLIGKDPNPSRDHVFHITFPKQWKISDLSQLFSPYGGAYLSWLSDTTAYAALYRRDQASAVIKNLFKSTQYQLQKYVDHQASLESDKTVKPERKRKIFENDCARPASEATAKPAATAQAAEDLGSVSPNQEDDGWEVASGNNSSKIYGDEDACVAAQPSSQARGSRPPKTSNVGANVKIATEDATVAAVAAVEVAAAGRRKSAAAKRSTGSPDKRKQELLRKRQAERPEDSPRRSRRAPVTPTAASSSSSSLPSSIPSSSSSSSASSAFSSAVANWCTCMRIAQLAGVLVLLYFFTTS